MVLLFVLLRLILLDKIIEVSRVLYFERDWVKIMFFCEVVSGCCYKKEGIVHVSVLD